MENLLETGIRNIIITSGTLSPLAALSYELKIDFPVKLENPHVIQSNQFWIGVISKGPSGGVLNYSWKTRDKTEYKTELGNALVNFCRIVPRGLLVFFPSYDALDQCVAYWNEPTVRTFFWNLFSFFVSCTDVRSNYIQ